MLLPRRYARLSRLPRTLLFDLLPVLLLFWSLVEVLSIRRALQGADQQAEHDAETYTPSEKVFISSIHLHDEELLRAHWNDALLSLVEALGAGNVYVSIYESNSLDNTKGALRELGIALDNAGVRNTIVLDESTRAQELQDADKDGDGWITTPAGDKEKRRIPYLARLRNRALAPLGELEAQGERFDRVLFLNDVVFTVRLPRPPLRPRLTPHTPQQARDILSLLRTNDGTYAAACALDFRHPPAFYDTFATRDYHGHAPLTTTFPFFLSPASRHALTHGSPVPVRSCWNGAMAMDAAPFYTKLRKLAFRGYETSLARQHVEASECCLVHADNPYASARGVFVNPGVRVAYYGMGAPTDGYAVVNPAGGGVWLSPWAILRGVWENRARRWLAPGWAMERGEAVLRGRIKAWEKDYGRREPGDFCAVDEMQVLRMDGWAHV